MRNGLVDTSMVVEGMETISLDMAAETTSLGMVVEDTCLGMVEDTNTSTMSMVVATGLDMEALDVDVEVGMAVARPRDMEVAMVVALVEEMAMVVGTGEVGVTEADPVVVLALVQHQEVDIMVVQDTMVRETKKNNSC